MEGRLVFELCIIDYCYTTCFLRIFEFENYPMLYCLSFRHRVVRDIPSAFAVLILLPLYLPSVDKIRFFSTDCKSDSGRAEGSSIGVGGG